jgi:RNA polymerase sigma factor (sigma-70 family)
MGAQPREEVFQSDLVASRHPGLAYIPGETSIVTLDRWWTLRSVPSNESESSAWASARRGDGEAFASIFDRHSDRIYRHARRLTHNHSDAEDVVAAAFLELWRRRSGVRVVGGSVLPWMLVTTTNLARNRARGLRRYRSMLTKLPRSSLTPGADQSAAEKMHSDEVVIRVQRALRNLKPKDAALVALTMYEGYTPAQAAETLGITPGNARTRLHRARNHMAQELGEEPEGFAWQPGKEDAL